jgi:selenophosphate synthetase-related protein
MSSAPSDDSLAALTTLLRDSRGIAHKRDIDAVMRALGTLYDGAAAVPVGDDCAAIPDTDGNGYLLFAIEGFINEFVEKEPWFAGYCGVMVNVSDIYAMGGRPLALVDALWSRAGDAAQPILEGLAAASKIYNVPIVGGHSNRRNDREQLSVAIIGRAKRLLTSFDACPGQNLVAAIDLRGRFS